MRLGHAIAGALDPLGIGVAIVEPRGLRVLFANEALGAMVGATPEDWLALPTVLGRVEPADVAAAEAGWRDGATTKLAVRLLHASGEHVAVDVSARSYDVDKGGRALALVMRDGAERTHRKALERALEDASQAIRARDEVLSMASHELRSPLASLRLHAQALARSLRQDTPDLTRARRSIAEVERHGERLTRMIDQLLDAMRLRNGRLALDRAPVDLAALVREVAGRFGAEAARTGSTIILDGEQSCPGYWDSLRLDQVVTNLLSNALKYGEHSPIAVELAATETHAVLSVRDYGPGIAPEEHQRIFEPFERASDDARVRGTGLGLWIVRRLVEAHDGSVCVMSAPGSGAQFIVELPRSARA